MNDKDRKNVEKIIEYCQTMEDDIRRFGDFEEYLTNSVFQRATAFNIIQIGEYIGRLSDEFKKEHDTLIGLTLKA